MGQWVPDRSAMGTAKEETTQRRSTVGGQRQRGETLFSQVGVGELIQPTFPPGPGVETALIYGVKTNFVLGYLWGVQMRRHNYLCEL